MNRKTKRVLLVVFDLLAIVLLSMLSYQFLNIYRASFPRDFWIAVISTYLFYMMVATPFHVYNKINRYVSIEETLIHITALTTGFFLTSILGILFTGGIHWRFMLLSYLFAVVVIPGSRVLWRLLVEHFEKLEQSALKGFDTREINADDAQRRNMNYRK